MRLETNKFWAYLDLERKIHDIKLKKQSFSQNQKRQKQKKFLERVPKSLLGKGHLREFLDKYFFGLNFIIKLLLPLKE